MPDKTPEQKLTEAENEVRQGVIVAQAADKDQQKAAVAAGLPSVPADHITVGFIPDPDDVPEVEPPAQTSTKK